MACPVATRFPSGRKAANKSKCQNNLKQIALAAHSYESTYRVLPPGYLGQKPVGQIVADSDAMWAAGANAHWIGVLPYLLPYVEADNLYRLLPINWDVNGDGVIWRDDPTLLQYATTKVKLFVCPTDNPFTPPNVVTRLGLRATGATNGGVAIKYTANTGTAADLGRTNYLGVAGIFGKIGSSYDTREGVFTNRSKTAMAVISDGTSNTLMFGESLGGHPTDGTRDYAFPWMGVGVNITNYGMSLSDTTYRNFSSTHPGVVHFALCDGSVRPLQYTEDKLTIIYLSGMRDGFVMDPSTLSY